MLAPQDDVSATESVHKPPGICGQLAPPLWILPPRRALPFSVPGLHHALSGHFCAGLAAFFPTSPHACPSAPAQGGLSPLPPGRPRSFSHMLCLEKKKLLSYSSHTRKHLHSARRRRVAARPPVHQEQQWPPAAATSRLGGTNPYRATGAWRAGQMGTSASWPQAN